MTFGMLRAAAPSVAALFQPVSRCWVCEETALVPFHECRFDYSAYARQDPELHAYTGQTAWLVRCQACGFGQPDRLPTLPRFFERMYDQRWSDAWIEAEFDSTCKDLIFRTILRQLDQRIPGSERRLLDVGAHAGRFLHLARQAEWRVEGLELNPRTAAFAARRTAAIVHQVNAHALAASGGRYQAITLTDVLEHIPEPVPLLKTLARLVAPGGVIAVKVPSGRSQFHKERVLSAMVPRRAISLAGNLVHVNHFTPASLRSALERAGFGDVRIVTAAPELQPRPHMSVRAALSNAVRLLLYAAARLPGGVHTPLALNLQAYASLPR
jgi:SAM-dependent methyltransferase